MSMTLGRFSTSEDPDAGSLRQSGDEVRFESMIVAADLNEFKARVQQLRGLVDNDDERAFPFTWSEDSTFDGFYTDLDVEVNDQPAMLASFSAPFSVRMRRVVGGFARPRFEVITSTVLRTNSHGVTTPVVIRGAMPTTALFAVELDIYNFGASGAGGNITTSEGAVFVATGTMPFTSPDTYRYFVDASRFYDGSARVEVQYGSTWYPIHGRHIPSTTAGSWRLSNGFCRVYPSTLASGRFTVEVFTNPAWVAREMEIGEFSGTWSNLALTVSGGEFLTPAVLQNRPDCAVVRLPRGRGSVDFLLRRGDSWAEVSVGSFNGNTGQWGVGCSSAVASTSFTGGLAATAGATRYLIACASTVTADTVNGRAYLAVDATSATFAVTADYLTGQTGGLTATTTRDSFLGARSEQQNVVSR